ncbi:DegV domain-containing protein [Corynebacterium choanae]|uniref:DegV domain-containing protein n=1 Tax=Corynebacterium choanae TaxID=1862358 RepID=A0A3G6J7L7_9CORY|nr:DegV domain-containing protein [Corynebacterium choanae]
MPVRIVTDSSSNLSPEVAQAHDIVVLPLHTMSQGAAKTTAGLTALELVACYARQLERGGDEGVVAIHLSKELSSTWANAVTAAGVFDDLVAVLDTSAIGMHLGLAAIAAAKEAQKGGDLVACRNAATAVLQRCFLFLYVHKIDDLRKSGRLSAATTLMSTALAIRPILTLQDGKLEVAAKTRTQAKGIDKLVGMVVHKAGEYPATVWVQHFQAAEAASTLAEQLQLALPADSEISVVGLDPALAVHAGPGSLAVTVMCASQAQPPSENLPAAPVKKSSSKAADFLQLLKQDGSAAKHTAHSSGGGDSDEDNSEAEADDSAQSVHENGEG